MIYLKTEMEEMPKSCEDCLKQTRLIDCPFPYNTKHSTFDETLINKRHKDCPLSEDTWKARCELETRKLEDVCKMQRDEIDTYKARCEGLMGLVEKFHVRGTFHPDWKPAGKDCNCCECKLKQNAKEIMEGV